MKYYKEYTLKNGKSLIIRSGNSKDGKECLDNFIQTHTESSFLLTYPEEITFTVEQEEKYLEQKENSKKEVLLLAFVDDKLVGTSGVDMIGTALKINHRALFAISIISAYQGLGIGKCLTISSIECAKEMGYKQLELEVVEENLVAINLYKNIGFFEYGKNEKGLKTKDNSYQPIIHMALNLE